MATLNFGLLDTTLPARIAAIPQEAQKQQAANMLQAIQTQGAMRQGEVSQMQLEDMRNDRAEMLKLQQSLAAKGGSPDLNAYADLLIKSPKHMALGLELKQKLNDQARFAAIMGPTAPAPAPAPAPEPGSFSADVATRKLDLPEWAQQQPAAPTNNLAAQTGGQAEINVLQQRRNALLALGTTQALAAANAISADLTRLTKTHVVAPGASLVGAGGVATYTAPAAPSPLAKIQNERDAMSPGDPRIPAWDAAIREASTAPGAHRVVTEAQAAERNRISWGQLNVAQRNAATNEANLQLRRDAPKLGLSDADVPLVAAAVVEGRLNPDRLNSTTASMFAKLLNNNPGMDFNSASNTQAAARQTAISEARVNVRQNLTPTDFEQAENIAQGNLPPATGANAAKIMNAVVALKPDYNVRDYGLQTGAEKAFNTGVQGNKTRSLNVAISHLATLETAAAALKAGDIRLINQFKQAWQIQTGQSAPTDFNAVRELVADEIVAAVVPGVGALADRKALKDTILAQSSPAQLQGVIKKYKELLGGQLGGLEQQYRAATGLTNFNQRYLTAEATAALVPTQTTPPVGAAPSVTAPPPTGVPAALWNVMTPDERKLWRK